MITLIRMIRLWQLKVKWQLAIMQELDKQLMTIVKNPEVIEKKILPYIAKLVHDENIKEKSREIMEMIIDK